MALQAETAVTVRPRQGLRRISLVLASALGLLGLAVALAQLQAPRSSLRIERTRLGAIPVTVFASADRSGPAVVIAHGFAGSQQLMYPFALTLARNGYTAITFDFPGHGQNSAPLEGALLEQDRRFQQLSAALDQVVRFARGEGRPVGLLGHSMGAEAVVRYAQAHPEINAVVAVSMFYEGVTPRSPRNLLLLTGGLERALGPTGQRIVDAAAGGQGAAGVTYGDMPTGTARRLVFAPGVEHIGVLFSRTSMAEALAWFDRERGRPAARAPFLDQPAPWLALLYLSATLLFWPLVQLVQPSAQTRSSRGVVRRAPRGWLLTAVLPALVTPFVLRALPVDDLLPILVGGPLAVFFAIYGLLTGLGLWLLREPRAESREQRTKNQERVPSGQTKNQEPRSERTTEQGSKGAESRGPRATRTEHREQSTEGTTEQGRQGRSAPRHSSVLYALFFVLPVALLVVGYVFLSFGLPAQLFVLNYFPPPRRLGVFVAVLAAMLPYFLADEALTRRLGHPRGAYALTKICFMVALALAILIDGRLFFLTLIAPLFLAYFAVYGWFSGLIYRRTGTLLPGALANAVIFAWSVAAVFPLVG